MYKNAVYTLGGVLVGMILMGIIVWFTMPSLMVLKHKSAWSYDKTVTALSEGVKNKQDWRVLTVNDYQKSTESFGAIERVGSINICNPRYASKVLADDKNRGVTAFMPLGIGIYEEKDGQVYIASLNFKLLGMMFGGTIAEVMGQKAGTDLSEVIASIPSN